MASESEQPTARYPAQTYAGKKFINTVDTCVDDDLGGFVALNPGVRLLRGHRVVVRADLEDLRQNGKVGVVCGGGAGHNPAFAGYVGRGMLAAGCHGEVFASPPPSEVLVAIRAVATNNPGGCLLLIPNYTGDRLNFGLAAQRAWGEGLKVATCVMGEDCAVTTADKTAGRRGLTGMIACLKIAGALAEEGQSLETIVKVVQRALGSMATIGVALRPCYLPGGGPTFHLPEDEMELGLGAHGEAGVRRVKLMSAKETVKLMLDHMTNIHNPNCLPMTAGDRVAVFVNDMGGISIMDLNIIAKETIAYLESKGIAVVRAMSAPFLSSMEMSGASVTVLRLDGDEVIGALGGREEAPCWPRPFLPPGVVDRFTPAPLDLDFVETDATLTAEPRWILSAEKGQRLRSVLTAACQALIEAQSHLNYLDSGCGDADCGSTHARGALAVLQALGSDEGEANCGLPVRHPALLAQRLAVIAEQTMGGAAGGCYGLFFTGASTMLSLEDDSTQTDAWAKALQEGIAVVKRYGGAEPGDRTMLDALQPALESLQASQGSMATAAQRFLLAAQAAVKGAESTAAMKARAGRASYVHSSLLLNPDPGAVGVATWLSAASKAFLASDGI